MAVSNPFQYQTAMIAEADPGFKGSGLRTDANAAQRLQFCVIAAKFLKVRCADEQALHGALLGGFGSFWIKGGSATCICSIWHLGFQFPGSARTTVVPGAAARRQDLRLSHTLADADSDILASIESVAWAPDGRLAASSSDKNVRVYEQAGSVGLGGRFLSYCATWLVLSALS